ncbi:hypothetical protein [Nonomuraea sp. NPDC050643]|uniref:GHMP family kinase ATP-binding protein n=1 Tax=Nonomuraea sp. NPDC050643 TaxID=3155660 RepID=UPI0033F559F3
MKTAEQTRPHRSYRGVVGVGTAFGTFGELLQGTVPEPDGDFLVTLPIARWSMATFRSDPYSRELRVEPAHKTKALRLTEMIIDATGADTGGVLTLESGLPEGKGMASSSADLVATARAVSNALRADLPCRRIEEMLRRIEPTDGVLYPGVVAYHHRTVRLRAYLGTLPQLTVIAIDEGGQVDTIAFNRIPKPFSPADKREYARLLDRLGAAVRAGDVAAVGEVATRSAIMNQVLQPKRTLAPMLDICAAHGGLGVVNAHSGTTLGVLLDTADPDYPDKMVAIASDCYALAGNVSAYCALTFEGPS